MGGTSCDPGLLRQESPPQPCPGSAPAAEVDSHECGREHYTGSGTTHDVFGDEANHDIKYKTLGWPMVAVLMITEIVSNGMLSLPSALASVGMVPGILVILFLGAFATYTAWALIEFKLRHPGGK